jgi:hypothetical protein
MVTLVKHEWHQVDSQFALELDEALLSEIYPDLDEDEITNMLEQIANGDVSVDEVVEAAYENDVELQWDRQHDDWWTDRKGGYDVTYELGDESSWVDNSPPEPTHKCTKCKWTGQQYDAEWVWPEDDEQEAKKVCPMCESEIELTPEGMVKEEESKKRMAEIEAMNLDDDEEMQEEINEDLEELKRELDKIQPPWPFENATVNTPEKVEVEEDSTDEVLPNYPAGVYTLRIWGRTREIGVGTISKEQYEYWSDEEREYDLAEALNENFDYDENETPEEARFEYPYYEYTDVKSFYGYDQDDTHLTIEDAEGNEIYSGSLVDFIEEAHGNNDSVYDASEEDDELYPEYLGKGYFVFWTQGGKGSCIQTTIDTEGQEFDPRKLKYITWDVQGNSIVHTLAYDGVALDDEGMDGDRDNWRGQWSDYSVHWNEK